MMVTLSFTGVSTNAVQRLLDEGVVDTCRRDSTVQHQFDVITKPIDPRMVDAIMKLAQTPFNATELQSNREKARGWPSA